MYEFDLRGPEFLGLYASVTTGCLIGTFVLKGLCQVKAPVKVARDDLDVYDAAYLSGGAKRAMSAALTSLLHRNLITVPIGNEMIETQSTTEELHPLEKQILYSVRGQTATVAAQKLKETQWVGDLLHKKLEQLGLIASREKTALFRAGATLLMLGPILFLGLPKLFIGLERHKPITWLLLFCMASAGLAIWFFAQKVLRTFQGDKELYALQADYQTLSHSVGSGGAMSGAEVALAVSLFGGLAAMSLPAYAAANRITNQQSSLSNSSCGFDCGGGSCGGGGCGGGGCGGCGG
jgi:uncharacterized protein (TIGR04222 family)